MSRWWYHYNGWLRLFLDFIGPSQSNEMGKSRSCDRLIPPRLADSIARSSVVVSIIPLASMLVIEIAIE